MTYRVKEQEKPIIGNALSWYVHKRIYHHRAFIPVYEEDNSAYIYGRVVDETNEITLQIIRVELGRFFLERFKPEAFIPSQNSAQLPKINVIKDGNEIIIPPAFVLGRFKDKRHIKIIVDQRLDTSFPFHFNLCKDLSRRVLNWAENEPKFYIPDVSLNEVGEVSIVPADEQNVTKREDELDVFAKVSLLHRSTDFGVQYVYDHSAPQEKKFLENYRGMDSDQLIEEIENLEDRHLNSSSPKL